MGDTLKDYWDTVQAIAEEAVEQGYQCRDDFVWESVDGSYWVIYYHAARLTLQYSDNEDALFEEFGTQEVDDIDTLRARMAFMAMRADVNDCMALLPDDDDN